MVHNTKNRDFPQPELSLAEAAAVLAAGRMPSAKPATPAWCAAAASLLEATARKPGNVHPEASFADLTHAELCTAAGAIMPALQQAGRQPLGQVIHAAVVAARAVSRSNANLGIVLAVAPLVAASQRTDATLKPATVRDVLASCTSTDAAAIYAAIQSAGAGGLGTRSEHDLATAPPPCIITAMRHAASTPPADSIAALWGMGYESLWAGPVADLAAFDAAGYGWEQTIIQAALAQLARTPDSLIARRHGSETAAAVSARAATVQALPAARQPEGLAAFDRFLRQPRRLNPGTTADLIAAALYIHLWTRTGPAKESPPPCPSTIT